MRNCFADTSYYLALANRKDENHARAMDEADRLPDLMVATAWVLTEVADALASPPNRPAFLRLLDMLRSDPAVEIIPADSELFDAGADFYARRPDKGWSLTDCMSFIVMGRRGIVDALTADHHFEQAGYRAMLKSN